jgi:hypothetical protein
VLIDDFRTGRAGTIMALGIAWVIAFQNLIASVMAVWNFGTTLYGRVYNMLPAGT